MYLLTLDPSPKYSCLRQKDPNLFGGNLIDCALVQLCPFPPFFFKKKQKTSCVSHKASLPVQIEAVHKCNVSQAALFTTPGLKINL